MKEPLRFDPTRCRVWNLHDRLEESITAESCAREIASTKEHGQILACLGRPVKDDPDYDVEIILGARRLFVARYLKIEIVVVVQELTDRQAVIAMDADNRLRKNISPYERGMSYTRWIRRGLFETQDDIASALQISASQVSRLCKLASLPSVIVGAFRTEADVRENWGLRISKMLEDPRRRAAAIQAARLINCAEERLSPREIFRKIMASGTNGNAPSDLSHDRVVKAADGSTLFRVRQQVDTVALFVPIERISQSSLDAIESAIREILQQEVHGQEVRGFDLPPEETHIN